jgi:hypothetical protein
MRKLAVGSILGVILLLVVSAGSVFALPVNNPHAEFHTLECDDGESYDIVVTFGNPGHILGSTAKLIPHRFTFALVLDDEIVFEESEGVGQGKKKGLQDRLITCTLQFELTDEDIEAVEAELGIDLSDAESVHFLLTVEAHKTPARN